MTAVILHLSLHCAGEQPEATEGGAPNPGAPWEIEGWDWSSTRISRLMPIRFFDLDGALLTPEPHPKVEIIDSCDAAAWALFATPSASDAWLAGAFRYVVHRGEHFEFPLTGIQVPAPEGARRED